MSNETTILRFDFGDRPQEVRTDQLALIAVQLQQIFVEAVAPFGQASVQLYHALAPRRGSIEFHFRAQINIQNNVSPEITPQPNPVPDDKLAKLAVWASAISAGASVATFLWTAVYGQNGIVHGAMTTDRQSQPNAAEQVLPELQQPSGLARLTEICMEAGADRVEIQVPDNAAVVVFDVGGRQMRGLIGRKSHSVVVPLHSLDGIRSVRLGGGSSVKVEYGGRVYPAVLADVVDGNGPPIRSVVVWGSNTLPQSNADVTAKLLRIQADELVPKEPVPPAYEAVQAVFFLSTVADWK